MANGRSRDGAGRRGQAAGASTPSWLKDAWGNPIKLVKRDKKLDHPTGNTQFDYYELVSAGPDGKFDTADDVTSSATDQWHLAQGWWFRTARTRPQSCSGRWDRQRNLLQLEMAAMAADGCRLRRSVRRRAPMAAAGVPWRCRPAAAGGHSR